MGILNTTQEQVNRGDAESFSELIDNSLNPSLRTGTWRLVNNPRDIPESFRYDRSCASWTGNKLFDSFKLYDH
jgi:hypothetical protein